MLVARNIIFIFRPESIRQPLSWCRLYIDIAAEVNYNKRSIIPITHYGGHRMKQSPLRLGAAYHGNRMPVHARADLLDMATHGMDLVVHMFSLSK